MKCPKCEYLGFETGDRCKNCGYDFSLLADPVDTAGTDVDLSLHDFEHTQGTDHWLNQLDQSLSAGDERAAADTRVHDALFDLSLTPQAIEPLTEPTAAPLPPAMDAPAVVAAPPPPRMTLIDRPAEVLAPVTPATASAKWAEPALPLFTAPGEDDDDAPLIKLPATPRAPLSVRRTPDTPRLRAVPKAAPRAAEPALAFTADTMVVDEEPAAGDEMTDVRAASRVWRGPASNGEAGSPARRVTAAAIDHAILFSIDFVVVYFTLRMAALDIADWAVLPMAPLSLFLVLIKFAYFFAFTAIGGQTIGKMATRIRVVTDEEGELDGAQAARRTLVGVLSAAAFGLGFLPGLVGDRKALHDRAAHTRVVGLESA